MFSSERSYFFFLLLLLSYKHKMEEFNFKLFTCNLSLCVGVYVVLFLFIPLNLFFACIYTASSTIKLLIYSPAVSVCIGFFHFHLGTPIKLFPFLLQRTSVFLNSIKFCLNLILFKYYYIWLLLCFCFCSLETISIYSFTLLVFFFLHFIFVLLYRRLSFIHLVLTNNIITYNYTAVSV